MDQRSQDQHMAGTVALVELLQLVGRQSAIHFDSILTTCVCRVFLWASLFYSCCMTGRQQGSIALTGEEARIGINPEEADDEAIARALQAEDPNWQG